MRLETKGCWDEDQRSLAFDLLGVPRILRDGFYTVPEANDRARLEILVKSKIDAIREEQEIALDGLDAHERELAACGMPLSEDAETKRLRKYETDIRRAWRTTHTELLRVPRRARKRRGPFPDRGEADADADAEILTLYLPDGNERGAAAARLCAASGSRLRDRPCREECRRDAQGHDRADAHVEIRGQDRGRGEAGRTQAGRDPDAVEPGTADRESTPAPGGGAEGASRGPQARGSTTDTRPLTTVNGRTIRSFRVTGAAQQATSGALLCAGRGFRSRKGPKSRY